MLDAERIMLRQRTLTRIYSLSLSLSLQVEAAKSRAAYLYYTPSHVIVYCCCCCFRLNLLRIKPAVGRVESYTCAHSPISFVER